MNDTVLPEQVRKQVQDAEALQARLFPTEAVPPPADASPSTAGGAPSVAATLPTAAPAPEPVDEESFAHKYRTLQGMYNAEVPRLQQQNRDMHNRVQQLEQLLANLPAQPAPVEATQQYVTDDDIQTYGGSIDVMRRVSRDEVGSLAGRLEAMERVMQGVQNHVLPQVQSLAQRQAASTEQQFWAGLTDAVPQWREINASPDFHTWLLQRDALTGITRQTLLEDAQQRFDVDRVAQFFFAWPRGVQQAPAEAAELQQQVSPGRGRSGSTPTGTSAKTYTTEDIKKFFDAVRRGQYRGREADRDRIERDIFAAQGDGRIYT